MISHRNCLKWHSYTKLIRVWIVRLSSYLMDDYETGLILISPITCDIKSFFAHILFSTYYIKVFIHFYLSLDIIFWYLGIKHSQPTSILLSSSLPPPSPLLKLGKKSVFPKDEPSNWLSNPKWSAQKICIQETLNRFNSLYLYIYSFIHI